MTLPDTIQAVNLRDAVEACQRFEDGAASMERIANELRQKCRSGGVQCEICDAQKDALTEAGTVLEYFKAHGDELLAVLRLCRREIDLLAWDLHASGTVDGEWPDNKFAAQDREEHARLTALLARIDALAAAEGGG